jgi:pantetheine-phosphate adenylyltransferase
MSPKPSIAVCPGSYDPITNGHIDVISRASAQFEEVVVAVVNLSVRKSKALFAIDERLSLIEEATGHLGNVRAEPFSVLVVDFARQIGARTIVKGLRAISDFEYEFEMAQLNHKLDPGIESVYVFARSHFSFLSSTGVKEMATFNADISDLVPESVAAALVDRLGRR